jgi:uncharacterized protein (TIGR00369 family)
MSESVLRKDISGTLPWSRACFVCGQDNPHGLQLRSRLEDGAVVLEYTPREEDLGWKHLVHGGITATLLDEVMTWAAMITARGACVAAEMTTRLRKPISVGEPLRAEGITTVAKPRLIITEANILSADGLVLASASGKYMRMDSDSYDICSEDLVTGPDSLTPDQLFRT